jgi:ribosome-associated protein
MTGINYLCRDCKKDDKMKVFKIEGEYIELIKLMKAAHLTGTGGEAKMMVEEGQVIVNGIVESRKRMKLRPGDVIEYNSQKIEVQ